MDPVQAVEKAPGKVFTALKHSFASWQAITVALLFVIVGMMTYAYFGPRVPVVGRLAGRLERRALVPQAAPVAAAPAAAAPVEVVNP